MFQSTADIGDMLDALGWIGSDKAPSRMGVTAQDTAPPRLFSTPVRGSVAAILQRSQPRSVANAPMRRLISSRATRK